MHLLNSIVDKRYCVFKGTKGVNLVIMHLLLCRLNPGRVLVLSLIVGKEPFTWSCIVGVLATQNDLDSQLHQTPPNII